MPHPTTLAAVPIRRRTMLAGLSFAALATVTDAGALRARPGAETLAENPQLHVLTTRRAVAGTMRAPYFDAQRAATLSYARAHLTPPDTSAIGRIASLVTREFAVRHVEPVKGDAMALLAEALLGRNSLLYVHGYNQTFEAAALDAAQLSNGIEFAGNTVLFSWPSKGGLLDYGYDRESALLARDHLADALSALLQDAFGARLYLVAHSMGTLVTLEALRIYRDRHGEKSIDRLGALVLAAPDVDIDVFRAALSKLGPWRDKMLVITTTNDRALDLSRRLSGGDRAGALPPEALSDLGIKVVDATDFASGIIRHDAFIANDDVRGVIRRAVQRN